MREQIALDASLTPLKEVMASCENTIPHIGTYSKKLEGADDTTVLADIAMLEALRYGEIRGLQETRAAGARLWDAARLQSEGHKGEDMMTQFATNLQVEIHRGDG